MSSKTSDSAPALIIIGAGGHAVSVADVAHSAGYRVAAFVDPAKAGGTLLGVTIVEAADTLGAPAGFAFAIAVGDNAVRARVHQALCDTHGELHFPALIHASAVISPYSQVEAGTVVMALAAVGPNSRIGRFCLINTRASLDHDCHLADYASLAPAAVTGGNVRIGERSAISIGAVIKHGLSVGQDSVLGANSYLHRDLADNLVAYGNPARSVRSRAAGEPYLS